MYKVFPIKMQPVITSTLAFIVFMIYSRHVFAGDHIACYSKAPAAGRRDIRPRRADKHGPPEKTGISAKDHICENPL